MPTVSDSQVERKLAVARLPVRGGCRQRSTRPDDRLFHLSVTDVERDDLLWEINFI